MKYDNRTGQFRGFAIIRFKEEASAESAVDETNRYRIEGRRISISFSKKFKPKTSDKTGNESCWFCYGNKDIKRHLICYVGKDLYIALPTEPITNHHFLIMPKTHYANATILPDKVKNELAATKTMLMNFITKNDNQDYFIFERNLPLKFENAMHMNLQVISLPTGAYDLDDRIQNMLRSANLDFQLLDGTLEDAFKDDEQDEKFYLHFEYPGLKTAKGRQKVRLLVKIPKESNSNHLMQIGRGKYKHVYSYSNCN
jgi:diadenosine tetraphosphate (Ap4A) HIT family hydrolase